MQRRDASDKIQREMLLPSCRAGIRRTISLWLREERGGEGYLFTGTEIQRHVGYPLGPL